MPNDANNPHQGQPHYLNRRGRRRSNPEPSRNVSAPRGRAERYARMQSRSDQRGRHGDGVSGPRVSVSSRHGATQSQLAAELEQARQSQSKHMGTASAFRRITRRKWFWPAVGVPGIIAVVALLVLSPLIWSSYQAYQTVQVENIEHQESNLVAQVNAEGTPELVDRPTEAANSEWNGEDRFTILLLGADLSSEDGTSRTDTIMLVNIDPKRKSATMLSIPRDTKVVIPGYGIDKINAAFALGDYNKVQGGGAGLMIRTIEANFGIPVHGFVQIDFNGFTRMIDTVGGLYIDVPYPLLDNAYPAENFNFQRIHFPAGWQHFTGEEALEYARTRHQDGDTSRAARQQQVLLALREQHLNADIITQLPQLILDFGDSIRTDISVPDALKLARLGLDIPRENIRQIPINGGLYEEIGSNGIYYLNVDWPGMEAILSEFTGYPVNSPGAAFMDPNYGARVLIVNGTSNRGLAGRVGTVLEYNGFRQISVDTAEDGGNYRTSRILDVEGNLGTSALVSELISVGQDTISFGDGAEDEAEEAGYGRYDIVIILGNDAWDPAGDSWTLEDYSREQQDREPEPIGTPNIEGN